MKLKAAILGAGLMGKTHGKNLVKLGVDVVAVCDTSIEALRSFNDSIKNEIIMEFDDFDKMLNEIEFDLLYICLPPFAHDGQFEKAASMGKDIFIEKPIALTTDIGKSMVDSAIKYGIITQVGFHMRFGSAIKKLRSIVESGKSGRAVLFSGQYECNSLHTLWWQDVNKSGGQILEQAIHLYDTCRYLFGHPLTVSGFKTNICHDHINSYTIEDVSVSNAIFENNAVASINATNCAVPGKWTEKFTAIFENISVFFENPNKAIFTYTKNYDSRYEYFEDNVDVKLEEDREFLECVINRKNTKCPIEEGYLSLCYVEAVTCSAKLKGKITEVKK